MKPEIAIVGGGLAGLSLAHHLHRAGVDFQLFEARDRFGGRIKTLIDGDAGFDLGPSWFWPGQPRMAELVQHLGLRRFDQYSVGQICSEDEVGRVHRGMGFASMEGSWRIAGGVSALINALVAKLPHARLHLASAVRGVSRDGAVTLQTGKHITARQIVLAIPPRVAATLTYAPDLSAAQMRALQGIPTWMGSHAKFVATYDRPFWREMGLSGDGISRYGPLAEIHDASGPDGTSPALFGFLGVPAQHRQGQSDAIKSAALDQLVRFFGPEAASPRKTACQDWATEPETATDLDLKPLHGHPDYGLPGVLGDVWDGILRFGSTEVARDFGGFLEGALAVAEDLANGIVRETRG